MPALRQSENRDRLLALIKVTYEEGFDAGWTARARSLGSLLDGIQTVLDAGLDHKKDGG